MWPKQFFPENFFSSQNTDFRFLGKFPLTIFLFSAFLGIGSLVFFYFWHKDVKLQYLRCAGTRFSKKEFPGQKSRKYAGKTGFLAFSRDFVIIFFWFFCTKMRISNVQNMIQSNFWRKFFSGRKLRKYDGNRSFCTFSLDIFVKFLFFHFVD